MSTAPVKSLIDEQLDEVESKLIMLGFGLPFNEVIGQPRERAVATLPRLLLRACHLPRRRRGSVGR